MATKKSSKKHATKTAEQRPAKRKKIVSLAEYEAEAKPVKQAELVAPTAAVSTSVAPEDKKKRSSGLDAAAQVLREAGEPLSTGEMVRRMLERGLWSTSGKTPAATIYAAILREVNVKSDQSRFRKTARGKFELTDGGNENVQ